MKDLFVGAKCMRTRDYSLLMYSNVQVAGDLPE